MSLSSVSRLRARTSTLFVSLVSVSKATQRHTFWCHSISWDAETEHSGEPLLIITPHLICPWQQMLRLFLDTLQRAFCVGFRQHFSCFQWHPVLCNPTTGGSWRAIGIWLGWLEPQRKNKPKKLYYPIILDKCGSHESQDNRVKLLT